MFHFEEYSSKAYFIENLAVAQLCAAGHVEHYALTSGGAGGNTTGTGGKTAGAGASIALTAGNSVTAPAGSKRVNGGNITLQPGSTGAGAGAAGLNRNVLIDPSGVGNVGIGTNAPTSRLTVKGGINPGHRQRTQVSRRKHSN